MQSATHPPAPSIRCIYGRTPASSGRPGDAEFDPPPDPAVLALVRNLRRAAPHAARTFKGVQ